MEPPCIWRPLETYCVFNIHLPCTCRLNHIPRNYWCHTAFAYGWMIQLQNRQGLSSTVGYSFVVIYTTRFGHNIIQRIQSSWGIKMIMQSTNGSNFCFVFSVTYLRTVNTGALKGDWLHNSILTRSLTSSSVSPGDEIPSMNKSSSSMLVRSMFNLANSLRASKQNYFIYTENVYSP